MAQYVEKATPPERVDLQRIRETVTEILERVRNEGATAVRYYSLKFDDWDPPSFRVDLDAIEMARVRFRTTSWKRWTSPIIRSRSLRDFSSKA
jgi:histidinol dehydrogenase